MILDRVKYQHEMTNAFSLMWEDRLKSQKDKYEGWSYRKAEGHPKQQQKNILNFTGYSGTSGTPMEMINCLI